MRCSDVHRIYNPRPILYIPSAVSGDVQDGSRVVNSLYITAPHSIQFLSPGSILCRGDVKLYNQFI